jgi:hypothetical protein
LIVFAFHFLARQFFIIPIRKGHLILPQKG